MSQLNKLATNSVINLENVAISISLASATDLYMHGSLSALQFLFSMEYFFLRVALYLHNYLFIMMYEYSSD